MGYVLEEQGPGLAIGPYNAHQTPIWIKGREKGEGSDGKGASGGREDEEGRKREEDGGTRCEILPTGALLP